ncbi:glycosyltransferase [Pseudonocardiaceae bacterium YIM PH 21723]|nr:glycosyltransferase [Pseudonocardiaceae bacterium YIM PH 21723]
MGATALAYSCLNSAVGGGSMSQPVSFLIPCAPKSKYLAETLRAIDAQTHQDWEVVLVFDGECEENRTAAKELPEGRVKILLTDKPRSGPAVARNVGLKECAHELVALCDADDLPAPDRLAKQVAQFEARPELGLLATWGRKFTDAGEDRGPMPTPIGSEKLAKILLLFNPMTNSTVMLRRSIALELNGFNPAAVRVEDYDLWLRFLGRAVVDVLPEELLRYRVHDGQYSRGRILGPQTSVLLDSKLGAARRLGLSTAATRFKHLLWLAVQVANRRW